MMTKDEYTSAVLDRAQAMADDTGKDPMQALTIVLLVEIWGLQGLQEELHELLGTVTLLAVRVEQLTNTVNRLQHRGDTI